MKKASMLLLGVSTVIAATGCRGAGPETAAAATAGVFDPIHLDEWVGADDGLLVWDRNGDGILQAEDLFGASSFTGRHEVPVSNGFEDLRLLDDNENSVVSMEDSAFGTLRVWRDADADGTADPGEILSLHEMGIAELRLSYRDNGEDVIQQLGVVAAPKELEPGVEGLRLAGTAAFFARASAIPAMVLLVDLDGDGVETRIDVSPEFRLYR